MGPIKHEQPTSSSRTPVNANATPITMVKTTIIFWSGYGHAYDMANAAAECAKSVEGAEVEIYQAPDLLPDDVLEKTGMKGAKQRFAHIPVLTREKHDVLKESDAVIFVYATKFGAMASEMKSLLDSFGQLWLHGSLIGKVGSCICTTATQHGGAEAALLSGITTLLHLGFVYVGLPCGYQGQMGVDKIRGGSPYGANGFSNSDGSRPIGEQELEAAKFQGKHATEVAARK